MSIHKTIWNVISAKPYRLQLFFDLLLLILSPTLFISIIGFDTNTLNMDILTITLIIFCYIYITNWFSRWYCKRRKNNQK
ncbi:hypothetical protein AB7179_00630 [Providencia manganoxydans]|uniref:Uncharacterized protein n=2 Tax=Providencia TaxID=586 RepID=A0A1S1HLV5_PROST|nr:MULTISPECIES: hypothetical protein [Providencia]MDV5224918.1 hypothetical protein [Providencia rettgeri]ELR5041147.1 hypothetical protein [Providencia stuartii]ELR5080930.1 hypothetical protein [Providencia stuartii]ELR5113058.1 hypothetical protein [Providencia stuartii]MDX4945303.1 hypothetical protein [Providencia manganoxydans]